MSCCSHFWFFFFNDTATTEIYTLSLHDALPISTAPATRPRASCPSAAASGRPGSSGPSSRWPATASSSAPDRKSTRLNSSHANISYAVFCLKKKKKQNESRGGVRGLAAADADGQ